MAQPEPLTIAQKIAIRKKEGMTWYARLPARCARPHGPRPVDACSLRSSVVPCRRREEFKEERRKKEEGEFRTMNDMMGYRRMLDKEREEKLRQRAEAKAAAEKAVKKKHKKKHKKGKHKSSSSSGSSSDSSDSNDSEDEKVWGRTRLSPRAVPAPAD